MLNSSLIEIFRTFSKDEFKSLQEFIESPFFNKKKSPVNLFRYIKKYYPELTSSRLHRESAWKALFPGKPYNYGVMKNLIHDLTKLTEEFISVTVSMKDEQGREYNIIKFLNKKKKTRLTEKYLDRASGNDKKKKPHDADQNRTRFNIEKIKLSLLYSKISDKHKINPGSEFEQSSRYLIESFLTDILENYVLINSLNKIHKSGFTMPLLEEILNFVKSNEDFLDNIHVKVYYYILLLDREQDVKYYDKLKKILSEAKDDDPASFKYAIWENICNYITFRYHAGETGLMHEQFELYKLSLSKKIYYGENEEEFFILNFMTFFNVALHLNELEWCEKFVDQFIGKLDEKTREDIRNHCLGSICIKRKEFLKANEYFSKIKKLHEPHMKAGLKLAMLIVYYELGWFESSLNIVDSFRHLLENEKNIQEVIKEKFRKFLKGYSMLIDLNFRKDESTMLKLKIYLENTKGIGSSKWLIRKANETGLEIEDKDLI